MLDALKFDRIRNELRGILLTLCMVAIVTAAVYFIVIETGLGHGSVVYLIPVLIAATRWGIVPAIVAAICGVVASAFFFYPPLYSFRIKDPHEVLNLILFVFVAVVVSQLATRLKRQLEVSRQREIDLRDLYAFSRRLAVAFDVSDIHAAIEDHLATVMQRSVVLFAGARDASASSGRRAGVMVPEQVLAEVVQAASGRRVANSGATVPADNGDVWLVRAVSPKSSEFGVIAINLGRASQESSDEMRIRVDAVLADATATLERLGVAHAIGEARMRSQTDQLREALIGSVSHELRTPLASILGAATVLSAAPALANEKKLRALVHDVRDAQPFQRRGGVGQDRVNANAHLVRAFLRCAAEIDRDDAEFGALGRHGADQPDVAAVGGHRHAAIGDAAAGGGLHHFGEDLLRHHDAGAPPARGGGIARAGEQHDVALHNGGEMVLDRGMNVGHVECHRQPAREGVEVAQVDLALA